LEDINSNVFIVEYGGDIISEDEMILIKRRDMSMQLAEVSGQKYYVGCVKHCSLFLCSINKFFKVKI
jgi:hypothetical protein